MITFIKSLYFTLWTIVIGLKLSTCKCFYWISSNPKLVSKGMLSPPCPITIFSLPLGTVSRQNHLNPGEPWVAADHPGLWLLWWVPSQVWLSHRVAILHRNIWLPVSLRYYWWQGTALCQVCLPLWYCGYRLYTTPPHFLLSYLKCFI